MQARLRSKTLLLRAMREALLFAVQLFTDPKRWTVVSLVVLFCRCRLRAVSVVVLRTSYGQLH